MSLSARFTIREKACSSLVDLLCETTLGTNGARYRHLDTRTRIHEADNPLFLSVEKDGKVQGNVTFCKRGKQWYVRYFAFSGQKQASRNGQNSEKGNSRLKEEITRFYDDVFEGKYGEAPEALYAYIDPNNERSRAMACKFGFRPEAQLITQSFSRMKPCDSDNVRIITDEELIKSCLSTINACHAYYAPSQAERPEFYGMFDANGELTAFTKITKANWIIERLPGNLGGLLTKVVPFIPVVRRIIKPKDHRFVVPESVWVKDNDPKLLSTFFEAVLAKEERNVLLWWVDKREPLWREVKHEMNWGLLHKLMTQTLVDVVVLRKNSLQRDELKMKPIFVAGWDMV